MSFEPLFARLQIDPLKGGHGEYARLFPVLSEKGKEGRAASILLACLANVPEFANEMLSPLGRKIGSRSAVACLTEIVLPNSKERDRPDGLIAVRTGSSFWTCIVEFKVGGTLQTEQVERYLRVAREHNIDALLTISNDIVPKPDVSPVKVDGRLTRGVQLFHVSWMQILSYLQLLVANEAIDDDDHRMIVREFIRFLSHQSTGIQGYTQMPSEWPDVVEAARDKRTLRKGGDAESAVVGGWMQEERELSLILAQQTGSVAKVVRSRAERADTEAIRTRHLQELVERNRLTTTIQIDDVAAPIDVELDLRSRTVHFSMCLVAPKDKARAKSCVTWLLRQLPPDVPAGTQIAAQWPGRIATTYATVSALREDPMAVVETSNKTLPTTLTVSVRHELQRGFSSRKAVINSVEDGVRVFYRSVGQNLKAWTPPAPRSRERTPAQDIVAEASVGPEPV